MLNKKLSKTPKIEKRKLQHATQSHTTQENIKSQQAFYELFKFYFELLYY